MGVVAQSGAQALLCVNYGTNTAGNAGGDPNEAAAWVDYANNTKGYGVKYWEVGNEVYGNGEYGASFETDLHGDHSPTAYGANVAQYVSAMKAKDATIKVGAVLTAPGQFPDGQSPDWNTNVLAQCGGVIDFVIVHWYPQEPGSESDSFLLDAPASQIATMVAKLRALISQYGGANAAHVQIFVTETNSVAYNPGKQTVGLVNALFIADDYATWLEQGVANVDIWTLHNGTSGGNTSGALYGSATYGDYGILSSGQGSEPATDTPFPSYYGIQMLSELGKAGDQFVSASSNQPLLGVHAVRQAGGNLALMLINKDPANSYAANVSVVGYTPAASSSDYFYGEASGSGGIASAASTAGATFTRTVPPYSLTTVVMQPSGAAPTPTPTPTPTATPTPHAHAHPDAHAETNGFSHAESNGDPDPDPDRHTDPHGNAYAYTYTGTGAVGRLHGELRGQQSVEQRVHRQCHPHEQQHRSHQRLGDNLDFPGQPNHHEPLEWQPHAKRPERESDQCQLQRRNSGRWFGQFRLPGQLQREQRQPDEFYRQRCVIRQSDSHAHAYTDRYPHPDTDRYPHPNAKADRYTGPDAKADRHATSYPSPDADHHADTDTDADADIHPDRHTIRRGPRRLRGEQSVEQRVYYQRDHHQQWHHGY